MKRRILNALTKALLFIAVLLGATACQSAHGGFCTIAPALYYRQPVYDAMTDREAARTLTYLKTGERLCGWKP